MVATVQQSQSDVDLRVSAASGEGHRRSSSSSSSNVPSSKDRITALDVTLHNLLGKGSYGSVYSATSTATAYAGECACKVLPWGPNEVSSDLKKELRLLQRCNSEYIVRAYGMFCKPRELWIVMELCQYGSLLDVMRSMDEPMPESSIAAACHDALMGLHYLHSQKRSIIHRDIKCANLLLSAEGRVKLADFGVAAQLNSTASKRSSVIGTPHWMAPEVIQNGQYDARADVWSLAISAIEMAQLFPPLSDVRPVLKVMFAIASGDPPQLESPDGFSAQFRAFLRHALVKDPKDRPSSEQLLGHPFAIHGGGGGGRDGLLALVAAAQDALDNPKPKRVSETDTGTFEAQEGGTLVDAVRGNDSDGADGGTGEGTFIARPSAVGEGGTFIMYNTPVTNYGQLAARLSPAPEPAADGTGARGLQPQPIPAAGHPAVQNTAARPPATLGRSISADRLRHARGVPNGSAAGPEAGRSDGGDGGRRFRQSFDSGTLRRGQDSGAEVEGCVNAGEGSAAAGGVARREPALRAKHEPWGLAADQASPPPGAAAGAAAPLNVAPTAGQPTASSAHAPEASSASRAAAPRSAAAGRPPPVAVGGGRASRRPMDDCDAMPLLRREFEVGPSTGSPPVIQRSASDDALYERTLQPAGPRGSPARRLRGGDLRETSAVGESRHLPRDAAFGPGQPRGGRPSARPQQVWNVTPRVCAEKEEAAAAMQAGVFHHRRWASEGELEGALEHNRCLIS